MPAGRSRGMDRAVFVVCVWSGTCVTHAPWKGADVLRTNLCGFARTPTGLCCTCSVRDIARNVQCDVQFFGVQFDLSVAIVPLGAQDQLRRSRDKG